MKNQFYDFTIFSINEPSEVLKSVKGSNNKGLFILLNTENDAEQHLDLLKKILGAIQYQLDQDAALYLCTPKEAFKLIDLSKKMNIQYVISFGISPKNLGVNQYFELYKAKQVGEMNMLFAHNLNDIATQTKLKGALWGALQGIFLEK